MPNLVIVMSDEARNFYADDCGELYDLRDDPISWTTASTIPTSAIASPSCWPRSPAS